MTRFWSQTLGALGAVVALGLTAPAVNAGYSIYVMGTGHSQQTAAINHLTALGHTVTTGGTLSNYSAYDQVWDLRYNVNLTAADVTAMKSYLQGGGSMYMTGENSGFDSSRNNSLVSWASGVGAGTLTLAGSVGFVSQNITAAGQIVNNPNTFTSIQFNAAQTTTAASISQGFLVTQVGSTTQGSLVGWDFGDITGAANGRMLIGFDIEIFANGQNWTQNMVTYLGDSPPASAVPAPAGLVLVASAFPGLVGVRLWRRRKAA